MIILKLTRILLVGAGVWHLFGSSVQGALTQPALTLTANPGSGANYRLGDGGHTLDLNLSPSGTLSTATFSVGGGFAFYSVSNLTVFDVRYAQSQQPFSGNIGNGTGTLQTPLNTPFYLGYYVQNSLPSSTINATSNDGYGWAELVRGSNGLSLIDSALQNPSGGIIVGTTTTVPEPSTWGFLGLGAATLLATVWPRGSNGPPGAVPRALACLKG